MEGPRAAVACCVQTEKCKLTTYALSFTGYYNSCIILPTVDGVVVKLEKEKLHFLQKLSPFPERTETGRW